ncbi:MAG: dNTP triphosphohydrolase [bacterium]|nr:dNTP triphosphohydrolase [bacterium]
MIDGAIRDSNTLQADEDQRLALWAMRSSEGVRRVEVESRPSAIRLEFQRDRDRILHSRAFRRLKHKTQVFVPHVADHPRTRLTHTLEVAQIGRTIARALGLNEDLVEAIALGHDLGHTAFGHTGETILIRILAGRDSRIGLPQNVITEVGTFKHNYQSLRVVDLLERRYPQPGLGLTDQVREGILKHTRWRVSFPFPLPSTQGLALNRSCHLEGQVVAIADEIAQQTHDLEDGLRAGSVGLMDVENLAVCRAVYDHIGATLDPTDSQYRRQDLLIRGMIDLFVSNVVRNSAAKIQHFLNRHSIQDRQAFLAHSHKLSQTTIWFSRDIAEIFRELKSFIYQFIINHPQVNRQDWRARKVITALFHAFWTNPLNLPSYVLLRANEEFGFPYLRDVPLKSVATEVTSRYHSSPGFARLVVDHIAGMSDRFALEEYQSLEQPTLEQRFMGDLR